MPAPMRKEFRVIRASPFEPLVVDRKLPKDGTISPLMVDEYYTPSHLSDELDDDDDDEEEDGSSKRKHARITDPPVDEVAIPLAAAAHQGLVKLSNDDWKKLYLTSMKELKSLHRYTCQMVEENRYLKRTLIQMQKTVYEARRSKLCTSTVLPWDIPESSPRKDAPNVSSTKSPRLFKDNV